MFPTRLYGALPRVFALALLLVAMLILAFAAQADPADHFLTARLWRHHQGDAGTRRHELAGSLEAARRFSSSPVAEIVRTKAEMLGVPAGLALAIMRYESGGRCDMHGLAGERGAMQVLPQTARAVGVVGNLYDCTTGIEAGLRYLKLAVSMHADAGWCAVASAYNSGTWQGSRCTRYGRAIALAAGLR
jgi:soluble lytic murein transglycosylase-like protein